MKEPAKCLALTLIAVQSVISLPKTDERRLKRRVYNIRGFCLCAGELAEEVKKHIPTAQISFLPDPAMMNIVRGWPTLDDTYARQEWNWSPQYQLVESVKDFLNEMKITSL